MQDEHSFDSLSREAQITWAAGLFEGEGCFNVPKPKQGRKFVQISARLSMTDEDVIRRFAYVVGVGSVRGPIAPAKENWKPTTEWYVSNRAGVRAVITLLYPYLGERRRAKADELLSYGETAPKGERTHCPNGHPLEGDNLILEPYKRKGVEGVGRRCRICRTEQNRNRARKTKNIAPERWRKD